MTQITGNPAGGEEVADVDTDSLPPTQYLVLEVLAARARLGEACWTFPSRLKPALNALQSLGLIWWRHAPIPDHVQAYLTDAGREAVLSAAYAPPVAVRTEWGVRVRRPGLASGVLHAGSDEDAEELARRLAAGREWHGVTGALVSRKVTIGPWTGQAKVAES